MQSNVRYGEKWLALIGLKIKLMTLVVSSIVYGTRNKGKEDWMEIDVGAKNENSLIMPVINNTFMYRINRDIVRLIFN